jgi:hypothetical protein
MASLELETPDPDQVHARRCARDYLVPSRVHPQQFYALPQSPAAVQAAVYDGGDGPLHADLAGVFAMKTCAPTANRSSRSWTWS